MANEKVGILAQLAPVIGRRGRFVGIAAVGTLTLFGMVAAFGTVPVTDEFADIRSTIVEPLGRPAIEVLTTDSDMFIAEDKIRRGDTLSTVLARLGIQDDQAWAFLRSDRKADAMFRQMSPGKTVSAQTDRQGVLWSLVFPLNGGDDVALVVSRDPDGSISAAQRALPVATRVVTQSAEIQHSLFGATDAAGIPDIIATQMADIFGGDIDFHRDIRKGDRFSVTYESVSYNGRPVRTGRVLAAEFINGDRNLQAIWYSDDRDQGGYYTAEGKNIRKAFLRSPLEFSRVTSGFSTARFHPVLKETRAHKGIDYGAPVGTKVRSTGDGIVDFVGSQGGYGKVVVIRHQGRYTTVYGHLSGYAAGLRKGTRVSQGDTVGFVGATGLATGPHLHYEFRNNGIHQNPLAFALPSVPPLAANQLAQFRRTAEDRLNLLRAYAPTGLAFAD